MTKKLVSESFSFTGSLDQSRNIFDHEGTTFVLHDSEIWNQSGKWIRSYFWTNVRDCLDEGRFSSIWKSDQSDICYELQLESYHFFLSDITEFCKIRSLSRRRSKMSISKTSSATTTQDKFLMCKLEIGDHFAGFCVRYERSDWNFDDEILCTSSVHILCSSTFTFLGFYDFLMSKIHKCRLVRSGKKDDISAISPISTIWSSFRNIFFFSPRNGSISSFSRFKLHLYLIDKHF